MDDRLARFLAVSSPERYPRAARYDPSWRIENQMGSDCLCLVESLTRVLDLQLDWRVLDLGCGKALTSIFLAKEFGVQVWATDLWISAADNFKRIKEAGVADRVFPIRADARNLPYADGYFDAVIGVNSLQFYGTDDIYLRDHLIRLVDPGKRFGIIVPGWRREFEAVPESIAPDWGPALYNWHSAGWWRWHLEKTGLVEVELADGMDEGDGFGLFYSWERVIGDSELCRRDGGENVTFVRLVARKL